LLIANWKKIPLPCGERIKVRGRLENQIIYDLQFKIYDWKTLLLNLEDLVD